MAKAFKAIAAIVRKPRPKGRDQLSDGPNK